LKTILFHINYLLAGGIEKVLIEILNELDPKKYHIKLSIGYHLVELETLKDRLPKHLEVIYLLDAPILVNNRKKKIQGKRNISGKLFEEIILPAFKKRAQRKKLTIALQDVDVVVDFDMTLAPYYDLLKSKKSIAYCHFSLSNYWDSNKRKLDKLARRLDKYDKVVMLCDEMKEEAAALYPSLANKLVRIYNSLDFDKVQQLASEPDPVVDKLKEGGYFVSVGRLDERQKDFTTLIKGYAQSIKTCGIKEHLVIVGEGPSRNALEKLASMLDISDKVYFTGYQPNPFNWMLNSKLFLFCTKYEGLPTVMIEAEILKKPIIATASPTGIKELLMYGEAGILIAPGDAHALAESICLLVNDTKKQEMFINNTKSILQEFDIKTGIKQFEKLIS